jgi:hypothetical protein
MRGDGGKKGKQVEQKVGDGRNKLLFFFSSPDDENKTFSPASKVPYYHYDD